MKVYCKIRDSRGERSLGKHDFPILVGGGQVIEDFDKALNKTIRSRFYHGSIPEGELARVRVEVAENLINRTLLLYGRYSNALSNAPPISGCIMLCQP